MEELGGAWFEGIGNAIRKKRSQTLRRPRSVSLQFHENRDWSPLTSSLPSDDVSKASSDENTGGGINSGRKDLNLNQCTLKGSANRAGEYTHKIIKDDVSSSLSYGNGGFQDGPDEGGSGLNQRCSSEGVLAPVNWKGMSSLKGGFKLQPMNVGIHVGSNGGSQSSANSAGNGIGNGKRFKKVKLKVGGVTHTIQTKLDSDGVLGSGPSTTSTSDAPQSRHKLILQDNSIDNSALDKNSRMRGIPWKDFPRGNASPGKEKDTSAGKVLNKITHGNGGEKWEPVRKSKRMPKRRVLDEAFDEEDDNEIRYLKKLKLSKVAAGNKHFHGESSINEQRILMASKNSKQGNILDNFVSSSIKDGKKKCIISERGCEDTDYEKELVSDDELEGKKKKMRKECNDFPFEHKRELALTTRQRALLSSKDPSSVSGASVIEFPNGLPHATHRKQKEKLTEVELQLKKAEAAQRRRLQVEKVARESEAEAIRKILGQDSSRKKREDKIKKRKEELEQAKAANALMLAASTIRWVMGPSGTVVTFPNDMGLPSIFNQKPYSYPCPREKCAGPFCTNPYKYRDSKSNIPLCSLQCYKAVHEKVPVPNGTTV